MESLLNIESTGNDLNVFASTNIRMDTSTNKIVLNDIFDMFKLNASNKINYYKRLRRNHPSLFVNMEVLYVNGKGHKTKVIDIPSAIEIVWVLPGNFAKSFRKNSASYLTRLMAGDRTLIDVIEIQHEHVSPQTRETMLAHVETPVLPQVSVNELQNIIERQSVDLNDKKEKLATALLTITDLKSTNTDLTKKNINLEKKVEKTIKFSKEWQSNCEFKLQMRMKPGDILSQNLSSELVNYMHREHDQKVDELESRSRDEVIEQLTNELMVSKTALDKFSKQHNKELSVILKDISIETERKMKMTFEDDLECNVDKIRDLEKKCLEYKLSKIESHQDVENLKKKLEEMNDLRDINTGLQCTIKKMKNDKDNIEEELRKMTDKYKVLKRKKTNTDKDSSTTTSVPTLTDREAYERRVILIGNLWPELDNKNK